MKFLNALFAIALTAVLAAGCAGNRTSETQSNEIAVNSFLWQASLDTMRFVPLSSADPFGGVILTEWYSSDQYPDERFKMTVYLLDSELRADAVSVNVNRQVRSGTDWVDRDAHSTTAVGLENLILSRARELKIASLDD